MGLPFVDAVNSYTKVAQAVIRLVAFALVLITFFLCADDIYLYLSKRIMPRRGILFLKAIPLVFGLALACKSRALAAHLTKDLD